MQSESKDALNYEIGRMVGSGDGFEIYEGIEKSINCPCVLHVFPVAEDQMSSIAPAVTNLLRRFGQLQAPRTPRLADAWFEEERIVAVEFKEETEPLNLKRNNPLQEESEYHHGQIMEASLQTVAALHQCGLIHGSIDFSSFGMGMADKIHLRETGLDRTIVHCIEELTGKQSMVLMTNLFSKDVAMWAFTMLSLRLGSEIVDEDMEEKWDEYHFQAARTKMSRVYTEETIVDFFMEALKGLGPQQGKFDVADDALKEWVRLGLGKKINA